MSTWSDVHTEQSTVRIGVCESQCNNFVWYIVLFSIFVFVHSTSEVGSMLLILRCVDPRDKAMALGLIQFAIGLFGEFMIQDHYFDFLLTQYRIRILLELDHYKTLRFSKRHGSRRLEFDHQL